MRLLQQNKDRKKCEKCSAAIKKCWKRIQTAGLLCKKCVLYIGSNVVSICAREDTSCCRLQSSESKVENHMCRKIIKSYKISSQHHHTYEKVGKKKNKFTSRNLPSTQYASILRNKLRSPQCHYNCYGKLQEGNKNVSPSCLHWRCGLSATMATTPRRWRSGWSH